MKIILNRCYGDFGASYEAYELYAKKKGIKLYQFEYDYHSTEWKIVDKPDALISVYSLNKEPNFKDEDIVSLTGKMRTDKTFIEVVEELHEKASSSFSNLKVYEIPDGSHYIISDYDGAETLYYSESEIKEI